MAELFATVMFVVVGVSVAIALGLAIAAGRRSPYDQVGRGRLAMRDERDRPPSPPPGSPGHDRVREEEIRQMLGARNARRVRRGQSPVEVDRELARLAGGPPDAALEQEIRQLVAARNRRRTRAGRPPLDVEAEVRRRLADLGGGPAK